MIGQVMSHDLKDSIIQVVAILYISAVWKVPAREVRANKTTGCSPVVFLMLGRFPVLPTISVKQ
jgi:hypothetical protein